MHLARWIHRATRAPLAAHVVPRGIAGLLAVVQLDVIVDWGRLAREAQALPPATIGAIVAAACLLAAEDAQRLLDATLRGAPVAILRRQPVTPWQWGAASLVVLAPLAAPLAALARALGGPTLLWFVLAWAPLAARRRAERTLAAAAAGGIAALAHGCGGALWTVPALAAIPLVGALLLRDALDDPARGPRPLGWRPSGPLGALIHRDALALWRRAPAIVTGALSAAPAAGLVAWLMARTGDWAGPAITAGVMVVLIAPAFSALRALTAIAHALGRRFDPPEWPVSASRRAAALGAIALGLLAPSWAAAAVAAPRIGHLQIGAYAAAIALGAAWWVAARPARPNPGTWPYWLGVCLAAASLPGGVLWATLLAGVAWRGASAALSARRRVP